MKPSPTPADAKVGICIATYGSVPYVHLGLEALHRHENMLIQGYEHGTLRLLVHDDSSPDQEALKRLCADYLVAPDFVSTVSRRVPTIGDTSAFVEALKWAEREGLDVVVKCSRRMILNKPWVAGLVELMHNTGYATASGACAWYRFGFRSELVAMHVRSWIDSGACAEMEACVRENRQPDPLPEAWLHHRARDVHRFVHPTVESASHMQDVNHPDCDMLVRYEQAYVRSDHKEAFADWALMGLSRRDRVPGVLWHDIDTPAEYAALSAEFGLPYTADQFEIRADHNCGKRDA